MLAAVAIARLPGARGIGGVGIAGGGGGRPGGKPVPAPDMRDAICTCSA